MKIGIDARNLVPRLTGIGQYVFEMSRSLALAAHDVRLYLPEKPSIELDAIPNATVEVSSFSGAAGRVMWGQTALPKLAKRSEVDVFWGPAHRLPIGLHQAVPRVVTIHDLAWAKAASTMHIRTLLGEYLFFHSALVRADIVVTDSKSTASDVKERFPKLKAPIVTVYPGTRTVSKLDDLSWGAGNFLERHAIDRPFALFVGTREPRKNLTGLLKAYASLDQETRSKCMLVVAGGKGWGHDALDAEVENAGLHKHVRLLGYVEEADLAALYSQCRFVIMPSLYEGFGLPIVEGNSFGAPALTSNVSSMPEIGGDAALLIDPHDIVSIAAGFARLVNDESTYARLAAQAKPNARRFTWARGAEEMVAVFKEAIALRRRNR